MPPATFRFLLPLFLAGLFSVRLHAQTVQPGLESAVKWKWTVLPSEEKNWGLPLPEPPQTTEAPSVVGSIPAKKDPSGPASPSIEPGNYEVKKGDALAIIARKSGVPVSRLKLFNALPNDIIRIGQTLKIPTPAESLALAPATPAPAPATPTPAPAPKKGKKSPEKIPAAPEEPKIDPIAEATLLQVFLDRENFSSGPIDGTEGTALQSVAGLYVGIHPELQAPGVLRAKAVEVVGEPYTTYKLRPDDFRFIAPPKATALPKQATAPTGSRPKKAGTQTAVPVPTPPPRTPPVTYEDLLAASYSAYRTPWEFVAEKFHCDETFLRSLNNRIKTAPTAETEFKVPNVTPFEIEKCFETPLQPKADAGKPTTATIVELSRLEIRQGDQLIAVFPISRARPGLRGRGTWTILGAVAGPRLATRQESNATPAPAADPGPGASPSEPAPTPSTPTLAADQILTAGPRNPVGVYWIDLAKANSTTPLPYGLHGTAIPSRTKTQESLGGFRLANWDIARAVRILPEGTPLIWK